MTLRDYAEHIAVADRALERLFAQPCIPSNPFERRGVGLTMCAGAAFVFEARRASGVVETVEDFSSRLAGRAIEFLSSEAASAGYRSDCVEDIVVHNSQTPPEQRKLLARVIMQRSINSAFNAPAAAARPGAGPRPSA